MPTVLDFAFTAIDLVRGAFVVSLPFFALAFLGSLLHRRLSGKYKFSWLISAVVTIFVFSFAFAVFAYLYPLQQGDLGVLPPELQPDTSDHLGFLLGSVFKVTLTSAVLTGIFTPFALLGSLIKDRLEKRKYNKYICMYAAVFACSLLGSLLFLFLFGWIMQGMLYLLYFAG